MSSYNEIKSSFDNNVDENKSIVLFKNQNNTNNSTNVEIDDSKNIKYSQDNAIDIDDSSESFKNRYGINSSGINLNYELNSHKNNLVNINTVNGYTIKTNSSVENQSHIFNHINFNETNTLSIDNIPFNKSNHIKRFIEHDSDKIKMSSYKKIKTELENVNFFKSSHIIIINNNSLKYGKLKKEIKNYYLYSNCTKPSFNILNLNYLEKPVETIFLQNLIYNYVSLSLKNEKYFSSYHNVCTAKNDILSFFPVFSKRFQFDLGAIKSLKFINKLLIKYLDTNSSLIDCYFSKELDCLLNSHGQSLLWNEFSLYFKGNMKKNSRKINIFACKLSIICAKFAEYLFERRIANKQVLIGAFLGYMKTCGPFEFSLVLNFVRYFWNDVLNSSMLNNLLVVGLEHCARLLLRTPSSNRFAANFMQLDYIYQMMSDLIQSLNNSLNYHTSISRFFVYVSRTYYWSIDNLGFDSFFISNIRAPTDLDYEFLNRNCSVLPCFSMIWHFSGDAPLTTDKAKKIINWGISKFNKRFFYSNASTVANVLDNSNSNANIPRLFRSIMESNWESDSIDTKALNLIIDVCFSNEWLSVNEYNRLMDGINILKTRQRLESLRLEPTHYNFVSRNSYLMWHIHGELESDGTRDFFLTKILANCTDDEINALTCLFDLPSLEKSIDIMEIIDFHQPALLRVMNNSFTTDQLALILYFHISVNDFNRLTTIITNIVNNVLNPEIRYLLVLVIQRYLFFYITYNRAIETIDAVSGTLDVGISTVSTLHSFRSLVTELAPKTDVSCAGYFQTFNSKMASINENSTGYIEYIFRNYRTVIARASFGHSLLRCTNINDIREINTPYFFNELMNFFLEDCTRQFNKNMRFYFYMFDLLVLADYEGFANKLYISVQYLLNSNHIEVDGYGIRDFYRFKIKTLALLIAYNPVFDQIIRNLFDSILRTIHLDSHPFHFEFLKFLLDSQYIVDIGMFEMMSLMAFRDHWKTKCADYTHLSYLNLFRAVYSAEDNFMETPSLMHNDNNRSVYRAIDICSRISSERLWNNFAEINREMDYLLAFFAEHSTCEENIRKLLSVVHCFFFTFEVNLFKTERFRDGNCNNIEVLDELFELYDEFSKKYVLHLIGAYFILQESLSDLLEDFDGLNLIGHTYNHGIRFIPSLDDLFRRFIYFPIRPIIDFFYEMWDYLSDDMKRKLVIHIFKFCSNGSFIRLLNARDIDRNGVLCFVGWILRLSSRIIFDEYCFSLRIDMPKMIRQLEHLKPHPLDTEDTQDFKRNLFVLYNKFLMFAGRIDLLQFTERPIDRTNRRVTESDFDNIRRADRRDFDILRRKLQEVSRYEEFQSIENLQILIYHALYLFDTGRFSKYYYK